MKLHSAQIALTALATIVLTAQPCAAQSAGKTSATAKAAITRAPISTAEGAATVGAYAVDLKTGTAVWKYNENLWLTPASITKVLTTGAALYTKGATARLKTHIEVAQKDSSIWTLSVRGEFDPTTDSKYFDKHQLASEAKRVAEKLKAEGITHLEAIVVDNSRMPIDLTSPKRLWEDIGNYYGSNPAMVNISDNVTQLYFSSPKEEEALCTLDSMSMDLGNQTLRSDVRTHSSQADGCYVYWGGGEGSWYATGSIPQGKKRFAVRAATPNPDKLYAETLATLLRLNEISVDTTYVGAAQQGDEIMAIESPTIADIITQTNNYSVNLFADALAFNLALSKKSQGTVTWNDAAEAVMSFWRERCGLKMQIFDGSGLAPLGCVSARTMVEAIASLRKGKEWKAFEESLPIVGKTGTARLLGAGTAIAGHTRAKSGSMTGVQSYVGVMTTPAGREIAFCIIVNHYQESQAAIIRGKISNWLNGIYSGK